MDSNFLGKQSQDFEGMYPLSAGDLSDINGSMMGLSIPLNMSLGAGFGTSPQNTLAPDASRFDAMIANSSHETLLRVGNIAHQQACYQLMQAQSEAARLKKEVDRLSWNQDAYNSLEAQLLGRDDSAATIISPAGKDCKEGIPSPATSPNPVTPLSISFQQCPAHVILGRGMKLHTPPSRAECPETQFWEISDWNSFAKPPPQGKKGGNHSVLYTELSEQQADDMRVCIYALFKSLASTGQAPAQSGDLRFEALAYIHSNLATAFPPLLRCEGGRWKIEKFISQLYSNWWRDRGKKYVPAYALDSSPLPKREASESPMPETPAPKRARPTPLPSTPVPRLKSSPLVTLQDVRQTDPPKPTSIPSVPANTTFRAQVTEEESSSFNQRGPTSGPVPAFTSPPATLPSTVSQSNKDVPLTCSIKSATPPNSAAPYQQDLGPIPTLAPPTTVPSLVQEPSSMSSAKAPLPSTIMDVDLTEPSESQPCPTSADESEAFQPVVLPCTESSRCLNKDTSALPREGIPVPNPVNTDQAPERAVQTADASKISTVTSVSITAGSHTLMIPATPLVPLDIPEDVVNSVPSKETKATEGPKKKGGRGGQGKLAKDGYDDSDYKERSVKLGLWLKEHPEGLQAAFDKEYSKYLALPLDNISRIEVKDEMKRRADVVGGKPRKQTQSKITG